MQELFQKIREDLPNPFDRFIVGVIIIAGALLGLETSPRLAAEYQGFFAVTEILVLWIFIGEFLLKLLLEGRHPWRYFLDKPDIEARRREGRTIWSLGCINWWRMMDFLIVALCVLPYFLPNEVQTKYLPLLRLVRILRLWRLAEKFPQLQTLVGAMIKSMPSIAYICMFLLLHFYVYAVAGNFMFAAADPERFGGLGNAMLTLFEVLTGNGFSTIMHDEMSAAEEHGYPIIAVVLYFVSFFVIGATIILNLFVGAITAEMGNLRKVLEEKERQRRLDAIATHKNATLDEQLDDVNVQLEDLEQKLDDIRVSLQALKASRQKKSSS
jgi:voltage-gated sodium channel